MRKSSIGYCKLCGKHKKLTYEHVPPESAFNSKAVKMYPYKEALKVITGVGGRMPWDTSGLKGNINQRGNGNYYLCEQCNNNTGSWYIREYVMLVRTMHSVITELKPNLGEFCSLTIERLHPLRILKAILTMFCDINNNCFGDDNLRAFLLDKESNDFNSQKYSPYLFLTTGPMSRFSGLSVTLVPGKEPILQTEIARYPIGITLILDKPVCFEPIGINIAKFADWKYDNICNVKFVGIPYVEINTLFPCDYRTKQEIIFQCKQNAGYEEMQEDKDKSGESDE